MQQQLTIALPESVPQPKYELFQRTPRGVVVGMEYISAGAALAEGLSYYGWVYSVRAESGVNMPAEQLVGKDLEGERLCECEIEAASDDD